LSFPLRVEAWFTLKRTGPARGSDTPWGRSERKYPSGGPDDQGRPEVFGIDGKQSYEVIVPVKVGNRRAMIKVAATIPTGGKDRTGRRMG
jgi:hypothetical protein